MILTISIGRKEYADAACQLAASASRLGIPVSVITDGNLEGGESHFEHVIPCHEKNAYRVKTMLPKFTPYEKTLYIDADSMVNHRLDLHAACMRLQGTRFAALEYARIKPTQAVARRYHWANVPDIFEAHHLQAPISALQSSVMYFESSAAPLFEAAELAYGSMKCRLTRDGCFPDELAFSIATSKTGIYPEKLFTIGCLNDVHNVHQARQCYILTKAGGRGNEGVREFYREMAAVE